MKLSALLFVGAAIVALPAAQSGFCQNDSTVPIEASPGDLAFDNLSYRAMGLVGSRDSAHATVRISPSDDVVPNNASSENDVPAIHAPGFYPADVSNSNHGPTIFAAQSHPLYVNNVPSHWGKVSTFLTDFGESNFVHVLDQYVGAFNDDRYTLGTSFTANYPIPANHTLKINDILALVHAGASLKGGGLGHIYHIFLPKGVDMCLPVSSGSPQCYSPDNPPAFFFCAFHGAVTFSDAVGHVLFSVEPYQDVLGCSAPPTGTANGQLIDSTNDTLSHELSETISDPNLNAWWVQAFTFANGAEIGDLCTRAAFVGKNIYSSYANVRLNGHLYWIQPEYSNQVHGCTYHVANDD